MKWQILEAAIEKVLRDDDFVLDRNGRSGDLLITFGAEEYNLTMFAQSLAKELER